MRPLTLAVILALHTRARHPPHDPRTPLAVLGQAGVRAVGLGALSPRGDVGPRVTPARPMEFQPSIGLTSPRPRDSFPPPIPGGFP